MQLIATLGVLIGVFSSSTQSLWPGLAEKCAGNGSKLKYLSGDALIDSPGCLGPNSLPYPSSTINRAFNGGSSRKGRQSQHATTLDPIVMQSTLLNAYREVNDDSPATRHGELRLTAPKKKENVNHHHHRHPNGIFRCPVRNCAQKNHFQPSSARARWQRTVIVAECVRSTHFE